MKKYSRLSSASVVTGALRVKSNKVLILDKMTTSDFYLDPAKTSTKHLQCQVVYLVKVFVTTTAFQEFHLL